MYEALRVLGMRAGAFFHALPSIYHISLEGTTVRTLATRNAESFGANSDATFALFQSEVEGGVATRRRLSSSLVKSFGIGAPSLGREEGLYCGSSRGRGREPPFPFSCLISFQSQSWSPFTRARLTQLAENLSRVKLET